MWSLLFFFFFFRFLPLLLPETLVRKSAAQEKSESRRDWNLKREGWNSNRNKNSSPVCESRSSNISALFGKSSSQSVHSEDGQVILSFWEVNSVWISGACLCNVGNVANAVRSVRFLSRGRSTRGCHGGSGTRLWGFLGQVFGWGWVWNSVKLSAWTTRAVALQRKMCGCCMFVNESRYSNAWHQRAGRRTG